MRALALIALIWALVWLLSRRASAQTTTAAANAPAGAGVPNTSGQSPSLIADINAVAIANGVPGAILYGIAATEQGTPESAQWNPQAVNLSDPYGGAWGLTQVLAGTASALGYQVPQELFDPVAALTATAKYLRKYSSNVDNFAEDAQLYNAGPNATFVDTAYIDKVLAYAAAWPNIQGAA
jgi:hypothetical protein